MPVPEAKIYNDAPDEFAEFLGREETIVTLGELGGLDNPFIKEGIYKKHHLETPEGYGYTVCPKCGNLLDLYFLEEDDTITCDNHQHGPWTFEVKEENCTFYMIDHYALAEFMSKGLGCHVCRQFMKTGWLFGKLRGYDVYFACVPTEGMYQALESTPKSVLIVGQNHPKNLPPALATRVIYLVRLLYVKDGTLHFANEVVEEKIPLPRGRAAQVAEEGKKPAKKKARPPVQVYTPYYLMMMAEWLDKLRKDGKTGQPSKRWIANWLHDNGPAITRRRLSERQIYRHIELLTGKKQPRKGKPKCQSVEFIVHWNGCLDISHVNHYSVEDLASVISKAFAKAKKMGYPVKPMKSMDATDFADKVKNPNSGQETEDDE